MVPIDTVQYEPTLLIFEHVQEGRPLGHGINGFSRRVLRNVFV